MDYSPRKIDIKLLKQVIKAAPPSSPKEIRDRQQGLVVRHQPSGFVGLYAVAGRGQRKRICDARGIVDETRKETLRWAINEARKFQGKAAAGELETRAAKHQIPTLRQFLIGGGQGRCYGEAVKPLEIQRLVAAFGELLDRQIDKIAPLDLARWTKHKVQEGAKPSNILRTTRMLHSALERATEWTLIKENPIARQIRSKKGRTVIADIALKPIEHRVRYLTADEEQRLRAALRDRDSRTRDGRASANQWRDERGVDLKPAFSSRFVDYLEPAVFVSMHTGLRQSELLRLTWSCIDFVSKMITVKASTAKSGKVRHVPMNAEVIEILKAWKPQGAQQTDFVFTTAYGVAIASPKKAWGTLMREAGIENFCWHDLRHTFASRLAMRGVEIYTIKELLGHASVVTTQIYAHLQPHQHHEAVAQLCAR